MFRKKQKNVNRPFWFGLRSLIPLFQLYATGSTEKAHRHRGRHIRHKVLGRTDTDRHRLVSLNVIQDFWCLILPYSCWFVNRCLAFFLMIA